MEEPVSQFIYNLNRLNSQNSDLLSSISNFNLLMSGLAELNKMIEMESLKDSVVKQIKFFLINSGNNKNFDGHMLHTVIYGPAGVGKTQVCKILVKIWKGLGIIKNKPKEPVLDIFISTDKVKIEVIERLQKHITDARSELKLLIPDIQQIKSDLRNLRTYGKKQESVYHQINDKPNKNYKINNLVARIEDIESKLEQQNTNVTLDEQVRFPEIHIIQPKVLSDDTIMTVVSRENLVAGYLGQTAIKTEKILQESIGKVLFIDEAYSIVNDDKDSYGKEALTVINRFMSEHPDDIIIVFAGYKDIMEQTIFKFQPGLKSRCTWSFEIDGYTAKGLSKIFSKQVMEKGWLVDHTVDLENFFAQNLDDFPAYGRDTNRFLFYCKMCYTENIFDNECLHNKLLDKHILEKAMIYMKENRVKDAVDITKYPHMYS
uniref:ATPase family protein n=1 Tax=Pithovirus LCPAC302 TaxID=2506593 RepID=A0A481Z9W3_9VIRU|nr:MAG: ATPase family protein [Pithovirus LCPAC302]